jgi:hypothetical protein
MSLPRISLRITPEPVTEVPEQEIPVAQPIIVDPPRPGAERGSQPVITLQGGQMALGDQAKAAGGHAYRAARRRLRDMRQREGGLPRELLSGKPPSVEEQRAYVRNRAWVPLGHEGGMAERGGVLWGNLVGTPGVAAGNTISALAHKPLRGIIAFGLTYILAAILVAVLVSKQAGIWMAIALFALAVVIVGALRVSLNIWPARHLVVTDEVPEYTEEED